MSNGYSTWNTLGNKRGFSLVEMLLALSIFSLIALSLYTVFSGGLRVGNVIDQKTTTLREVRWIMDRLEKDLGHIVPYNFTGSYSDQTALQGAPQKLSFIIRSKDGLKFVQYSLKNLKSEMVHKVLIGKTTKKNENIVVSSETIENRPMAFAREELGFLEYLDAGLKDQKNKKTEILSMQATENNLKFSFRNKYGNWQDTWENADFPMGIRLEFNRGEAENANQQMDFSKSFRLFTAKLSPEQEEQK